MIKLTRKGLRDYVIQEIEKNFEDSVAIWCCTGIPDEESDKTEQFEALWIADEEYRRFRDFVWEIETKIANPNGFTIMVHDLNPEETKKYRWEEYQDARRQRSLEASSPKQTTIKIKQGKKTAKRSQEKIR